MTFASFTTALCFVVGVVEIIGQSRDDSASLKAISGRVGHDVLEETDGHALCMLSMGDRVLFMGDSVLSFNQSGQLGKILVCVADPQYNFAQMLETQDD